MVKPESPARMAETQQRRGLQLDPAVHGVSAGAFAQVVTDPLPPLPAELTQVSPSPSASMGMAQVHGAAVLAASQAWLGLGGRAPVVFGPGGRVKTQAGVARDGDPLSPEKVSDFPLTNSVTVPLRTTRGQNDREHHMARTKRVRKEHIAVGWSLVHAFGRRSPFVPPLRVTLTRHAPSTGLDDDNLSGSMKAVRDAVADYLGVDDKHSSVVRYAYAQKRTSRTWAVRIEIIPMEAP